MVDGRSLRAVPLAGEGPPALLALVWAAGEDPGVRELLARCRSSFALDAASV
jgi:hypothetical protein